MNFETIKRNFDRKLWSAAMVGVLTGLWGWLGWLVVGWVALMALDYLTGFAAACKAGEILSEGEER